MTEIIYSPDSIKAHLYSFWKLINQPLIGWYFDGGATAIDFALNYPQAVEKLVLINSVGFRGDFPLGKFFFPPFHYVAVDYWQRSGVILVN